MIAQVQVDDAYWTFTQDPPGELARLSTAWIHVPFPWVLGEAHVVKVVSRTGTTFDHEIEVAVPTPQADANQLVPQAFLGAFVGVFPVAIGLMFYPVLRGVSRQGMSFLWPLRLGFSRSCFSTSKMRLNSPKKLPPRSRGRSRVLLAAAASFALLWFIGRRRGAPTGLALATYIALGIGLHNLGEGLAIGAAFAAGAAGLGSFLVLRFLSTTSLRGSASPRLW